MSNRRRRPEGTPSGGEFAPDRKQEAGGTDALDGIATSPKYLDVVETAKVLRKTLKREFDGTTFSVRSDRYAGGAAINVAWTDGPTPADVRQCTDPFVGKAFDPTIDLATSRQAWMTPDGQVTFAAVHGTQDSHGAIRDAYADPPSPDAELIRSGADHVNTYRTISDEFQAAAEAEFDRTPLDIGNSPMQCRNCMGLIQPGGEAYVARGEREHLDGVCSVRCGATHEITHGHIRPERGP